MTDLLPVEENHMVLAERFERQRAILAARPQTYQPNPALNEIEQAAARAAWEKETQDMIREQIATAGKLRRVSAGPAKKGGKRAKAAPIDLQAIMAQLGD